MKTYNAFGMGIGTRSCSDFRYRYITKLCRYNHNKIFVHIAELLYTDQSVFHLNKVTMSYVSGL